MNISDYILTFLTQYNSVEIKGFGVFSFENSKAEVKTTENIILPPAKKVLFTHDEKVKGVVFLNYLSQQKGISIENVEFELQTQIDFWQKKISAKDEFPIGKLGDFKIENDILTFKGNRIEKQSPDFFGLEKISFSEFMQTKIVNPIEKLSKENPITKYVLWLFLILLPIFGIAYAFYTYRDVILGKKEIGEIKTSTHRIDDTHKKIIKADSLKIDSLYNQNQQEIHLQKK